MFSILLNERPHHSTLFLGDKRSVGTRWYECWDAKSHSPFCRSRKRTMEKCQLSGRREDSVEIRCSKVQNKSCCVVLHCFDSEYSSYNLEFKSKHYGSFHVVQIGSNLSAKFWPLQNKDEVWKGVWDEFQQTRGLFKPCFPLTIWSEISNKPSGKVATVNDADVSTANHHDIKKALAKRLPTCSESVKRCKKPDMFFKFNSFDC